MLDEMKAENVANNLSMLYEQHNYVFYHTANLINVVYLFSNENRYVIRDLPTL